MNTICGTIFGIAWAIVLCAIVQVLIVFGWGQPNVIPEEGETYAGWWAMLFMCGVAPWAIWGVVFDVAGCVQRFFFRKA